MQAIKRAGQEAIARAEQSLPPGYVLASQPDCVESPLAGLALFREWMQMHSSPFVTLAQLYVHLMANGRGAEAFRRSPIAMYFVVTPSNHPHPKPWNTWKIKRCYHRSLEDLLQRDAGFSQTYDQIQRGWAQDHAALQEQFGSRYIGPMPIAFLVESTYMHTHSVFPIFALLEPEALQDPLARMALDDLTSLCLGYINVGIPLVGTRPFGSPAMFPSRFFRKTLPNGSGRKDWAYKPLGTREHWDARSKNIFRSFPRKTQADPVQLTIFFWELCHRREEITGTSARV